MCVCLRKKIKVHGITPASRQQYKQRRRGVDLVNAQKGCGENHTAETHKCTRDESTQAPPASHRCAPERYLDDLLEPEQVAVETHEGVGDVHATVEQDSALHGARKIWEHCDALRARANKATKEKRTKIVSVRRFITEKILLSYHTYILYAYTSRVYTSVMV